MAKLPVNVAGRPSGIIPVFSHELFAAPSIKDRTASNSHVEIQELDFARTIGSVSGSAELAAKPWTYV